MALLAGIKEVDLTQLLPGPLATWHLRGLGASVVKVEPPGGDYARSIGAMAAFADMTSTTSRCPAGCTS